MDKVWQRESELAGNPTLMLWDVLDEVEEKLPVQNTSKVAVLYIQLVAYSLYDYIVLLAAMLHLMT